MAISTQLQQLLRVLLPDKGFKTAGSHRDAIIAGVEESKTYTDEKAAEAVKKTGNETIAGVKTFSDGIVGNVTGNTSTVTNGVYTVGNQTIEGVKTFTSAPIVPDATLPQHPVTLNQGVVKTQIKQTTGTSETDLMSQKTITNKIQEIKSVVDTSVIDITSIENGVFKKNAVISPSPTIQRYVSASIERIYADFNVVGRRFALSLFYLTSNSTALYCEIKEQNASGVFNVLISQSTPYTVGKRKFEYNCTEGIITIEADIAKLIVGLTSPSSDLTKAYIKINMYFDLNHTSYFNTYSEMINANSDAKIQMAGNLIYNKIGGEINPAWDYQKGLGKVPHMTVKGIVPPAIVGDYDSYALATDMRDNVLYFIGWGFKRNRVYKSLDFGETLIELVDIAAIMSPIYSEFKNSHRVKVLPNGELLYCCSLKIAATNEIKTTFFVTTERQTVWSQVTTDGITPFYMTHYAETNVGGDITVEVSGKLTTWGFDAYKNFVLLTEYSHPSVSGVFANPINGKDLGGHMIIGKLFLSTDFGVTFNEIFDYHNTDQITFDTPYAARHSHGCFIDRFYVTNGNPRLVGIFGDSEQRLVSSDDLGLTWQHNRASLNGYSQSVNGFSTSFGYLMGTDNAVRNGIQLLYRNRNWANVYSDLVYDFMTPEEHALFDGTGLIVHVCACIYRRDELSPIFVVFTPETTDRYNAGARGGIGVSYDGGKTWEEYWRDPADYLINLTQYPAIFQGADGRVFFSPTTANLQTANDGLGPKSRLIIFD